MRISMRHETIWFDVVGEKEQWIDGRRKSKPTMIFLHGGGGTHEGLRPLAARFADLAQCVLFDLPGHGRSSLSDKVRWNLSDWADDVSEFCHRLDIQQPIILGASMGGFVAQSVAVRHSELASKLVLIVTAARRDKALVQSRFGELGGQAASDAYAAAVSQPDSADAFSEFLRVGMPLYSRRHGSNLSWMKNRPGFLGARERETLAWFSRPGGDFDTFDFRASLASVHTPTLVIAGAYDPVIPLEAAREMYLSFPSGVARWELLDDASHLVMEDQPEELVRLVREFIAP